jgi:multidrug efflux pump subunit AcrB
MLALMLFHIDLNVMSIIGIVLLIGIVKKNAIMMIDFALAAEREGKTTSDAIFEACMLRFRPIMMTTVAAIAGTLPIAIGIGATGASRRPLGVTVVGGLAFSQIVTLYVTPVFYTYLDELQGWMARKFSHRRGAAPQPDAPLGAPVPTPAMGD